MRSQTARQADEHAVLLAVLAHMVTKADDSVETICFVNLSPSDVDRLRRDCGVRYQIFPMEMSEEYTIKRSSPDGREDVSEWRISLNGTQKEGVHIEAEVTKIHDGEAIAIGSYQGRLFGSGWRFRLQYSKGVWSVVSGECTVAV